MYYIFKNITLADIFSWRLVNLFFSKDPKSLIYITGGRKKTYSFGKGVSSKYTVPIPKFSTLDGI